MKKTNDLFCVLNRFAQKSFNVQNKSLKKEIDL